LAGSSTLDVVSAQPDWAAMAATALAASKAVTVYPHGSTSSVHASQPAGTMSQPPATHTLGTGELPTDSQGIGVAAV
jgi:hypothetical protein